jgi:carbonic anhydrase
MKTNKLILSVIGLSFIANNVISGEKELPIGKNGISSAGTQTKESQTNMNPKEALQKLKDGNKRFVENKMLNKNYKAQVKETAKGQYPYAVILSCLDSRTSSELIFDLNMGDSFNARIAGNFENEDILGSMEFACKAAGAKLIVVVGHTNCGAVKGACDKVEMGNLTSVIKQISPVVESTPTSGEKNSKNHEFVEEVSKQNVLKTMKDIRERWKKKVKLPLLAACIILRQER